MKRRVADPIVQATTIVVVLKLIKVRAYTCVRLGKNEKVRSHWRRPRELAQRLAWPCLSKGSLLSSLVFLYPTTEYSTALL